MIAKSLVPNPLNRNEDGIFFLVNNSQTHEGKIIVVDKEGGVSEKKSNIKNGKLFFIDGKFYSAAAGLVDRAKVLPALWGENKVLKSGSEDKYYYDYFAGKFLFADGQKSFERPFLNMDGEEFGEAYSSALIHPRGDPVYFKQEGKKRTLMLGRDELYSYRGYYGKPVDVLPTGAILFVAPTQFGSGLFIYTQGETIRVGSSDLVIDGRWLRNQEFLVCEISEKGYEYKILKVKSLYQRPYEYAYFFEKDEFKDDIPFKDRVGEIGENYLKDNVELDYNALKQLRFSRFNLFLNTPLYGASNIIGDVYFVDPLGFNNLQAYGETDTDSFYKKGFISYLNTKSLLNWGATFEIENYGDRDIRSIGSDIVSLRGVGKYHYFRKDDWDLFLRLELGFSILNGEYYDQGLFSVDLFKQYSRPLSLDPFLYHSIYLEMENDFSGFLINGLYDYSFYFGENNFFQFEAMGTVSNRSIFTLGSIEGVKMGLFEIPIAFIC